MSIEDLEIALDRLDVEPPAIAEPTSIDTLVSERDDVVAITAQREIEDRFNNDIEFERFDLEPRDIFDPSEPPLSGEPSDFTGAGPIESFSFVLGYTSRLIRSVLAISGASATAERFGDVRKSQGFWVAMSDLSKTNPVFFGVRARPSKEVIARTKELAAKVPGILLDPEVPENALPSIGKLITEPFPELEPLEWIYTLVGELLIEANVAKATKTLAKKGMAKLTKNAYEAGEEIVKKKGIKRLLGQLDDEEMKAIADAVEFRKVGKLGTKPPQVDIDDAVRRTFDYIEESKPSRLTKKEVITARRKTAAAKMYDIQGDGYGPGYAARLRAAGATKATEKSFTPLVEVSAKAVDDLTVLQRTIDNFDFGGSKIYTTTNTQDALAKLYEYGELLTPGEVEGLRDVFGSNFADSLTKFVSKPVGFAGNLFDAGSKSLQGLSNTSRTLMTTGELSFLLRQGNYRAWSRPMDAVRSWSVASRSLISPKYADKIDEALRFTRTGKIGTEHGLFLGRWRDVKRLTQREEVFMAEWLDKVPVIGRFKKGFERGYVNGLNQIRADWFDEGLQLIENAGRGADDKLISKWAAYVNNMTGRADIDNIAEANKVLKGMAETAKDVLFAPRFAASKWNRHKVAAELMFGRETPNSMRRLLAGDAVKKWRRYERLVHYFEQNGGSVEKDPRSSDFLKLRVGNTRFDVLGGDTQLQVMMARLVTGETKDTTTGLLKDNIASEIAQQYLAGKLNPLWSLIIDKTFGRTFDGKDIDDPIVLAKVIRDKFIPLYFTDIKDKIFNEYEEQGKTISESIKSIKAITPFGFAGGGIQTFSPSARKKYELMVEDKSQELHGKSYDELPVYLKEEVLWEAENDDIDKTELLKEEMGMQRQTRSTSARLTKIKNKSFRTIRKGLGDAYTLFKESNIPVREFPIDIGDVRLSTEQHDELSRLYVKFLKQEIKQYPELSELPPLSYERRRWLEDIESFAREDAIEEIIFNE